MAIRLNYKNIILTKEIINKIKNNTKKEKCWLYLGHKDKDGYPRMKINKKLCRISRIVYEMNYGSFDQSLMVCHKCDNPSCINPKHLFLGTAKDNKQDCIRKKRLNPPRGINHWHAKFKDDDIRYIRKNYIKGHSIYNLDFFAKKYNVCMRNICFIIQNKTWRHVK